MIKKLLSSFMAVVLVIAVVSSNALAFSSSHSAIYSNNTNIDVLIAADNTYSGNINEFVAELKAALGGMGSISDTVNISKVQSNVSLANFDDWYVYDHYYNPDYPTNGAMPSDWEAFSGRHPYFYYKESSYEFPYSVYQSAEVNYHETLWPEYNTAIADLSTFSYANQFYKYTGEVYPYSNLSSAEKAALEPQIVAGLNSAMGTSFASLSDYYSYMAVNMSYYPINYYFLIVYGNLIYPTLDSTQKNDLQIDFYYNCYITPYTWSSAWYTIYSYIYSNYSERDLFITDITSPGNMDWVYLRDKHIYTSIDNENNADITFIGYSSPAYKDFMIYPMESDSQKTVNFDIDASKVYTHTLEGAGFLINSGIDESGYIEGYILYYRFNSQISGTVYLLQINEDMLASTLHNSNISLLNYATTLFSQPFLFDTTSMKKNIDITISSTSVTCVDTDYIDDTTLSDEGTTLFGETKTIDDIGVYGYGPITGYVSHGCSEISAFTFKNLKMEYESSSVTALRSATYVDEAKKVYILLTGAPETDTSSESYYELITRLDRDQIFYVTYGGSAIINAIGRNGLDISESPDAVADIAAYLGSIYNETITWEYPQMQYPFTDLLPVAIFDILDTQGDQVITIDQRHLGDGSVTLTFRNLEKSVALAPDAGELSYHFAVYNPNRQLMTLEGDENNEITIDSSSAYGTYIFQLMVSHGFTDPEDVRELRSVAATRQLIVLNDSTPPAVARVGGTATPHTGSSITLNLSDSGSGVAAYAIGKATGSNDPVYEDEILLDQPLALKQILISTENADFTLYVKVYDDCGNQLIWSVAHAAQTVYSGGSDDVYYTITASAGPGGSITPSDSVQIAQYSGKKYTITPSQGYEISDVLVDGVSVGKVSEYNFSSIKANHTISAVFALHGSVCPSKSFADVDTSRWYHEGIDFVILAGLFNGTSETTFQPDANMTRSMLVTVLWRLDKEPESTIANLFADVAGETWYTDAVAWAAENNIVKGYDADKFGPNDPITREQMAAILFRYASYKGYDITLTADLSAFNDTGDTSEWALTAVKWAVAEGLITGVSETRLDPAGNASRAQVATILMRFVENIAN